MTGALATYLAIFTPVLALGLLGGWIACRTWDWHRARKPIGLVPTEQAAEALSFDPVLALLDTIDCTWCRPKPHGMCSCSGRCGHIRCVGRHPGRVWTPDDAAILDGRRLP